MPWSHCDLITIYMYQFYQLLSPLKFVNSMRPYIIYGRGLDKSERKWGVGFFLSPVKGLWVKILLRRERGWSLKTNATFLNDLNYFWENKIYIIGKFLGYLGKIIYGTFCFWPGNDIIFMILYICIVHLVNMMEKWHQWILFGYEI